MGRTGKKLLAGLLCFAVLLGGAACNGKEVPEPEVLQPQVTEQEMPSPEPEIKITPVDISWQEEKKAPTSIPSKVPTKVPTVTIPPTKAPKRTWIPVVEVGFVESEPMPAPEAVGTYTYSDKFAMEKPGKLLESDLFCSENEMYIYLADGIWSRAETFYFTFAASSEVIVEPAVKRILQLPGVLSASVEKKECYENGAVFRVEINHVPEYVFLMAWKTKDATKLSGDGKKLLRKATEIVELAEQYASVYEKVVFFHDYLVLNTKYDMLESDSVGQTAYGALVEGRCVCMGYTNAFFLLLSMAGIENEIVYGEAGGEAHAWNKVWIDDGWYHVDVTWDDPLPDEEGCVQHTYLNVTDEFMARTHIWKDDGTRPATQTKWNYAEREMKNKIVYE